MKKLISYLGSRFFSIEHLISSIERGDRASFESYMQKYVSKDNIDATNSQDQTALRIAVLSQSPYYIEKLLAAGASPYQGNEPILVNLCSTKPQPLIFSDFETFREEKTWQRDIAWQKKIISQLQIFKKYDYDFQDSNNALLSSFRSGNKLVTQYLLKAGANPFQNFALDLFIKEKDHATINTVFAFAEPHILQMNEQEATRLQAQIKNSRFESQFSLMLDAIIRRDNLENHLSEKKEESVHIENNTFTKQKKQVKI